MRRILSAVLLVGALAACGPGAASPASTAPSTEPAAPPSAAAAGPTVSDAWAHAAAKGGISAAYFTLANPSGPADALVSATSPVAGTVEIHQTTVEDGVAAMKPAGRIELPVGTSVEFEPGGYHVMLIDLSSDLTAGSKIELDLVFEQAGHVVVEAEIRQG